LELLADNEPGERAVALQTLNRWRTDDGFAVVRDDSRLEELPTNERALWKNFWARVVDLEQRLQAMEQKR
jgi:hypothetical protein